MQRSRRRFLRQTLGSAFAGGLVNLFGPRFAGAVANAPPDGRFKRCIVLWMEGGPSQLDSFDPKRGGPRRSVATNLPGVQFANTLAGLAERADQLCVLRSVGSNEGEHTRATELMHTGFSPQPSFPRPPLGAMISHDCEDPGFPRFVTLGGTGLGPAFLGSSHGPFVIEDIEAAREQLARVAAKRDGLGLLQEFNHEHSRHAASTAAEKRSSAIESLSRLLDTSFPSALDLTQASADDRERYGDHSFGQRVLTAGRLSKLGVPFVEAQLPGWDTHVDNTRRTDELCRQLQQPWLALIDDLLSSGRWDETLIVWMGEFGRTPRLNAGAGRDHFPEATPIVLAGGNLGGRVVGSTSEDGSERTGERHSVADLMATILELLGADLDAQYTTNFGSPTTKVDDGKPIAAVVA